MADTGDCGRDDDFDELLPLNDLLLLFFATVDDFLDEELLFFEHAGPGLLLDFFGALGTLAS